MIDDTGVKMDYICVRILKAMKGFESSVPTISAILSRINPDGEQHIDMDEPQLQDRLKIIEDEWGYVKTYTKPGVSGNDVYKAELADLGRQYLRETPVNSANELVQKFEKFYDVLTKTASGRYDTLTFRAARDEYVSLRTDILSDNELRRRIPKFVISSPTLDDFSSFIKDKGSYSDRRSYLRSEFQATYSFLYDIPANDLADQVISDEARSEVSDVSNFIESAVLKAKDSSSVMQRKNDETTANSGIAISNSDDIKSKRIWVIHGRNEKLVRDIFSFLRAIDLHPIEWSEARAKTGVSSPYIGEILKAGFDYAQAFVVMLTGDDEAKLRNEYIKQNDPHYERNLTPQARQNVIFEAGMAFGRDPGRIIFVQQGNLRPFSNISGIHILELNNTPQARIEFISRLKSAGCDVPDVATRQDWLIEGDFEPSVSGQSNSVLEIQASSLGATRSTENNLGVPENPKLSKEAQTLLKEATQDPYGIILRTNTSDGLGVKSNEKNFVTDSSPRTRALWEGAIRELVEHDLIKDRGHNQALFEVTIKGFQVEEKLQEAN